MPRLVTAVHKIIPLLSCVLVVCVSAHDYHLGYQDDQSYHYYHDDYQSYVDRNFDSCVLPADARSLDTVFSVNGRKALHIFEQLYFILRVVTINNNFNVNNFGSCLIGFSCLSRFST